MSVRTVTRTDITRTVFHGTWREDRGDSSGWLRHKWTASVLYAFGIPMQGMEIGLHLMPAATSWLSAKGIVPVVLPQGQINLTAGLRRDLRELADC